MSKLENRREFFEVVSKSVASVLVSSNFSSLTFASSIQSEEVKLSKDDIKLF